MDRRRLLRAYGDKQLIDYVLQQARRHFSRLQDMENARDQAWEEIAMMPGRPSREAMRERAYRAINNLYDREHRKRAHLAGGNIDGHESCADGNG